KMAASVEYPKVKGLGKLNTVVFLTMLMVFGFIVFIGALVLWYMDIGGIAGISIAILFSAVIVLVQWYLGPILIKRMTNMREMTEKEHPEIFAMVRRISRDAGIPVPKLYIVYNSEPNAFAFGRTQSSSNIALHTGLLNTLNEREVEGVIAHEIGHIKHKDVAVMTVASMIPIMLFYIVIVLGSGRDNNRGGVPFIAMWIGAMIAQFIGQLLVLWLSRKREYCADAFSAYITKNPVALMSGLAKITYGLGVHAQRGGKEENTDKALRCFYIADPNDSDMKSISQIARAIDAKDAGEIERAIENEKKMLGGEFLRTHPFTAKRLLSLWNIEKELHKGYRSVGAEY
ncbi:MAG: hypothetical protein CVT89_07815, partial [Candidatus Altiarchaeales archaeon HGW-Altiarchaeales-2]